MGRLFQLTETVSEKALSWNELGVFEEHEESYSEKGTGMVEIK